MILTLLLVTMLTAIGLFVVHFVRFRRSSPEKQREMLSFRALWPSILLLVGFWIATGTAAFIYFDGRTIFGAFNAARLHLRQEFGRQTSWNLSMSSISRSTEPREGSFKVSYTYGSREGVLLVEYRERDGAIDYTVTRPAP